MSENDHDSNWAVGISTCWREGKSKTYATLAVGTTTMFVCPENAEFIAQQLLLVAKAVRNTNTAEEKT